MRTPALHLLACVRSELMILVSGKMEIPLVAPAMGDPLLAEWIRTLKLSHVLSCLSTGMCSLDTSLADWDFVFITPTTWLMPRKAEKARWSQWKLYPWDCVKNGYKEWTSEVFSAHVEICNLVILRGRYQRPSEQRRTRPKVWLSWKGWGLPWVKARMTEGHGMGTHSVLERAPNLESNNPEYVFCYGHCLAMESARNLLWALTCCSK